MRIKRLVRSLGNCISGAIACVLAVFLLIGSVQFCFCDDSSQCCKEDVHSCAHDGEQHTCKHITIDVDYLENLQDASKADSVSACEAVPYFFSCASAFAAKEIPPPADDVPCPGGTGRFAHNRFQFRFLS